MYIYILLTYLLTIEWYQFRMTSDLDFKVAVFFDIKCYKRCKIEPQLLWNINWKSHGF